MEEALEDFANICADPPKKRDICSRCERPFTVCYCSDIAADPISIKSHLFVLQHPNEVKRCLRTTKIMELSLPSSNYHLFRGKRFSNKKYPLLHNLLQAANSEEGEKIETVLVFPSTTSQPLSSLPTDVRYNIVLLDGTWSQARVLYNSNPFIQTMKCVRLENSEPSRYVIRTQPTETCVSTVEAAAMVLAHLEQNPSIYETLTRPLNTICEFQLNKGAVEHQSKEYLITNGLYTKPLNKKVLRQLELKQLELKDLLS